MPKSVLIISFSSLDKDPRVRRELFFLKDFFTVTAAGYTDPKIAGVDFIPVDQTVNKFEILRGLAKKIFRLYEYHYWAQKEVVNTIPRLEGRTFDVVLANDLDTVPLVLNLFGGRSKIIFDAHEYSPMEHSDSLFWNLFFKGYNHYLIKTYAGKCDRMLTVCTGIAEMYKTNYNLDAKVLTNAADYVDITFEKNTDGRKLRIIHHGYAHPSRKLEKMIRMMDFTDERFELSLMLVYSKEKYYNSLVESAKGKKNVHFLPAVPMNELIGFSSDFDIAIYLLEPSSFNNQYALPNKFFEFIQSRLMIAIGPSPEMASLVKEHNLGIVSDDFTPENIASKLNSLTLENINDFRQNAANAAQKLSSETNRNLLKKMVEELAGD
jgi:hypothetical protein